MLFIAAAGNESSDNDVVPNYPSNYGLANIIAVAATDNNDTLASFSNYGANSVDLAAPGVNILSTIPGGSYTSYDGTSMATPHVSGVAALAWSYDPTASPDQIRNAILGGVDPVAGLAGKVATGGRSTRAKPWIGWAWPSWEALRPPAPFSRPDRPPS